MVSLLRNDERENSSNAWWACWHSLNVCVLAPTLPSVRQRNPLYLPQVKGDRALTRVHTQITGIHSRNGVTVRDESWLASSLGGYAVMRLRILLLSSLLLRSFLCVSLHIRKDIPTQVHLPAHQQFQLPFASLRSSYVSNEPHRSQVKGWLSRDPVTPSGPVAQHVSSDTEPG